jgi:hypothetical protein
MIGELSDSFKKIILELAFVLCLSSIPAMRNISAPRNSIHPLLDLEELNGEKKAQECDTTIFNSSIKAKDIKIITEQ